MVDGVAGYNSQHALIHVELEPNQDGGTVTAPDLVTVDNHVPGKV